MENNSNQNMENNKKFVVPADFNLENHFNHYLKLVKIDPRKVMPFQLREMRRAFYGGIGILLVMQNQQMKTFSEDECVKILNHLFDQVEIYWKQEIIQGVFNNQN